MTALKLSNYISKNIDCILAEWEKFAMDIIPVSLSPVQARDHAKGMLRAIVADMEQRQTPDEQSEKSQGLAPEKEEDSQAQLHGSERQTSGFSMPETVSEFRALRATVLRLWNESSATAMQSDLDGMIRFNEAVDKALAESVVRFAVDKEAIAHRLESDLKRATTISDTIIECAPGGFFMIDEESRLVRWNEHFRKETGLSEEQLRGQSILSCIHEQDRPLAAAKFLTAFATGYTSMEIRVSTADRGIRLYLKTARRLEVDGVPYVASFGIDVTERKQAEEALANEKNFFDAMVESTPGAFYVIDAQGNYRRWNNQLNRLTGLTDRELHARTWLLTILLEDRTRAAAIMKEAIADGYAQAELQMLTHDQGARYYFISFRRFVVGDEAYLVGAGVDNTDRRATMKVLEHQAQTDPLTQVANRSRFVEIANQELARCRRYGHPASLWMIDIDHFKAVNDTYGHHGGDVALQSLVATSRQMLRDWDIVGRMGGEEFAVLLPETDAKQSLDVAERLRQAVAATEIPLEGGAVVRLTISTGVATANDSDTTVDTLLERADKALYAAKNSGRDKVCEAPATL
ncbi:sensor domain-containing diguanylate cyclase [Undibacterium sp. Ren11W]|uniref:sensor domain-containing diguanylate cyclase n=1 Tax=Undibacterium sp. Ren11W TaxID=3413045 RepID=UPI003BF39910